MKIRSKIQLIGSLDENKIKPHLDFLNEKFLSDKRIGLFDNVLLNTTLAEIENKIFDNAYGAAISDTVVWHGILKNHAHKNEIKCICKKIIDKCVADYFCKSIDDAKEQYRAWHTDTMDRIMQGVNDAIKKYNPSYSGWLWTIGNSQKVLNLMMKYFWVIVLRIKKINPEYKKNDFYKKYWKIIHAVEEKLDITVDTFVIYSIYSWNIQQILDCKYNILDCKYNNVKLPIDKKGEIKEWSKWNINDYNKFSSSLHDNFKIPIIWECYAFIVGKLQKNSNGKNLHINPFIDLKLDEASKLSTICTTNGFEGHEDLLKFLK